MNMKFLMKVSGFIAAAFILSLLVFRVARADDSYVLAKDQVHDGVLAKSAERITIEGTVNGDLWVAASQIDITGEVRGNVYAVGSRVIIRGNVMGSVHALGSEVRLDRSIAGSVYAAGSLVATEEEVQIGRTTGLAGSDVMIHGKLAGQLFAGASRMELRGQIGSGARLAASEVVLSNSATVGGDLRYTSRLDAVIPNDKAISGKVIREMPPEDQRTENWSQRVVDSLIGLIMSVVTAVAVLALWGDTLVERAQLFRQLPIRTFGRGVFFTILVPVVCLLVMITLIGLPLGIILGLLYAVVLMVAPTAAGLVVGLQLIQPPHESSRQPAYGAKLQATVLGLLIISIVGFVPLLGPVFTLFVYLVGVGVIIATHPVQGSKA